MQRYHPCLRESLIHKLLEATPPPSKTHCTGNLQALQGFHYWTVLEAKQWVSLWSAAVLNFFLSAFPFMLFRLISNPQAHPCFIFILTSNHQVNLTRHFSLLVSESLFVYKNRTDPNTDHWKMQFWAYSFSVKFSDVMPSPLSTFLLTKQLLCFGEQTFCNLFTPLLVQAELKYALISWVTIKLTLMKNPTSLCLVFIYLYMKKKLVFIIFRKIYCRFIFLKLFICSDSTSLETSSDKQSHYFVCFW